jgi:hypothetical protein
VYQSGPADEYAGVALKEHDTTLYPILLDGSITQTVFWTVPAVVPQDDHGHCGQLRMVPVIAEPISYRASQHRVIAANMLCSALA